MYSYDKQIRTFEDEKVRLPKAKQDQLYERRAANRNRLKNNLPEEINMGDSHFIPQGSMAIDTTIQEKDENYDIDDGVWFYQENLDDKSTGEPKSVSEVKEMVKVALSAGVTFKREPKIMDNCVRVFYDEGYHVDVPAYRAFNVGEDNEYKEIAGESGWKRSDPTEITSWFEKRIEDLNDIRDGLGGQLRIMVKLMKRFARSRGEAWDMPNGLKLTMLVEECMPTNYEKIDECFYHLMETLSNRLAFNLEIENQAQGYPRDKLTKSSTDSNMLELRKRINEALTKLNILLDDSRCTQKDARKAWDWVFQTEGYFDELDTKTEDEQADHTGREAFIPATVVITHEPKPWSDI